MALGGVGQKPARRKLDDESSVLWKGSVLPARNAARLQPDAAKRQSDEPCVAPLDWPLAAGIVDQSRSLVIPDADLWPHASHEHVDCARFRLREGPRAGVELALQPPPMPGGVPIEVDAVRVLAGPRPASVRVELVDDPDQDPRRQSG